MCYICTVHISWLESILQHPFLFPRSGPSEWVQKTSSLEKESITCDHKQALKIKCRLKRKKKNEYKCDGYFNRNRVSAYLFQDYKTLSTIKWCGFLFCYANLCDIHREICVKFSYFQISLAVLYAILYILYV